MDKTGYIVSASSEYGPRYLAYKAVDLGNVEWATNHVNNNFWFTVKCLEKVRVWKFTATAFNVPKYELLSWRFEGSNERVGWITLRDEFNYTIGPTVEQIDVNT